MKRTLKIILPLVLVIAILATACWFFFFHRPDLTSGFFLGQAENMVEKGRYERAIRYYSWAWALDGQDQEIPIALAETYVAANNYTKAEYTLVKAIASQPDRTALYISLCKTYIAQDKLLDAVQMLDRTTDPAVKAELDSMRPAAPAVLPESGYYTDYINVSIESDNQIYASIDSEYPSTQEDLYTGELTLPGGETTVIAVAINDIGLVSPVVRNGYTIGGVVEEVTLSDPTIDAAVREQLNLASDDTLMTDDLWEITTLRLPETTQDLTDLAYFTGLRSLTIQNISGMDFTALRQLPALEELDLSGCTISSNSLEAIGSLVELRRLVLNGCALTDITGLSQLTNLTELQLSDNSISDIGVVSLMLELESVYLANNPITSIAGLSTCAKLRTLDIANCSVSSIGSLSGKAQLETLLASNNQIGSLDELIDCSALSYLDVTANQIEDISVLVYLPELTRFLADNNLILDIPDFDEDNCKLVEFSVDYNQIEDISGLAGIDSLNYLNIDYNAVKDLTPLTGNFNLIQVNAWDNPIEEEAIAQLEESSVIVNYNPNYEPPEEEEGEEDEDSN